MGARSLPRFGALHRDELTCLLASVAVRGEGRAIRGRLLRLLGDDAGARRELRAALAAAPSARAAGWLGELTLRRDPRAALALLARAEALDPAWPWPRLWKAEAHLRLRKPGPARAELDAFLRLSRARPFVARLLSFEAALMDGDARDALREAEGAIKADPSSPAGFAAAARALHALGRRPAALARAHEARDLDLDVTGAFLYETPSLRLDWSEPRAFLSQLDAAIAARPRLAALYAERAELKRLPAICLYEEALEDYAKAAALEPRRAWLRAVLGRARNNLHGAAAGLEDFDRAVRLSPRCGWVRAWRGALFARLGRRREALADLAAAARLMPWYSFTYAWRGALRNRLKDFAGALRDLETALRLDPSYAFSVYERYRARRGLGDLKGALADLDAAFRADPKYVWDGPDADLDAAVRRRPRLGWLRAWRGRRRLEQGRAKDALSDLDAALVREPGSALILVWRGQARRAAGRDSRALADLKRAARLEPSLWAAHQALSEVLEARGEAEGALRSMSEAARLAPTTVAFALAKGRLELGLGRWAQALGSADRSLQLDASSAEGRALKARALVARAMAREKARDAKGRISDFSQALALAPEIFTPEDRRAVAALTR